MTLPGTQPPAVPGQPQYSPPPAKPVNPKLAFWTSPAGIISMLAIAGALMLVLVGVTNMISGPASDNFKVSVTSCTADRSPSLATAKIGLSVTNTSKATRSATVKIEYRDGGGSRLDTDTAYVRNIAPGDTARAEESTLLDAVPTGTISCEIVGIS